MKMDKLFHVLQDEHRIVMLLMANTGDYREYCLRDDDVDTSWPRYQRHKPYLQSWFDDHIGDPLTSPYSTKNFKPGAPDYPRILALNLTHDKVINFWAYVTPAEIYVTLAQVGRALGSQSEAAQKRIEAAGHEILRQHGARVIGLSKARGIFGDELTDRIVLYTRQVADFLGVTRESVPDIVKRLGIGLPGRSQVGVPWGTLQCVKRIGPRSFDTSKCPK
jgi:hypothetical protein